MSGKIEKVKVTNRSSSLSYKHNLGNEPLMSLTIGELLQNTAIKHPNRPAIISKFNNKTITYSELLKSSDKLAVVFRRFGLKKGDRVGIWAPNCIEWEVSYFACSRIGLIAVHLNPAYVDKELQYCIDKVGIKCLVCMEKTDKKNFYEVLKEIDANLFNDGGRNGKVKTLERVIMIGTNTPRGTYNFEKILQNVTEDEVASISEFQHEIDVDSGSNILFTSGSTGDPKAALLTHHNFVNNSYIFFNRLTGGKKHHKILTPIPFFHTFATTGAILGAVHSGSTIVIPTLHYKTEDNLKVLSSEKCTIMYGTPTMHIDMINKQKELGLPLEVEIALSGGAPITPQLVEDLYNFMKVKNVMNVFGMTETTGVIFQSLASDNTEVTSNTIGYISEHAEVKIVDDNGKKVPFGHPGELCVRGYLTMLEYYGDDKNIANIMGRDRWMKTGDTMILYENGYAKFIGRIDDMILRGGENIYPKEIENVLSQHSKIIECQVVGIPHERLGEEVCACVRLKPKNECTLEEIQTYCKNRIAPHKIPTKLRIVDEFPKTASGKIQKFKIVEEITQGLQ